MHVIFDLNGTVFGALDQSLRPGIAEIISALRERGIKVDFWTSGRKEDYRSLLKQAKIEGAVFSKLTPLPFCPDLCVDDEPEDWMPGRKYRVEPHLSISFPGTPLTISGLLHQGIFLGSRAALNAVSRKG